MRIILKARHNMERLEASHRGNGVKVHVGARDLQECRYDGGGAWSTQPPGSAMPITPTPSSGGMVHSTAWICHANPCDTIVGGHGPLHRLDLPCQHSPTPPSGRMVHSNQRASRQITLGSAGDSVTGLATRRSACSPPLRSNLGLATRRAAKVRWSLLLVHGLRSMKTQREAGRD